MCTDVCLRPRDLDLAPEALSTLADLYAHPVVRQLADAFKDANGELYVVGGPVRDALRGHADFADLDFTTNLRPHQTKVAIKRFGKPWTAGERFGTLGVTVRNGEDAQKVEVTTFRTEVYAPDSRKPEVGFGDNLTDDLRRRDLTVNAIAMNVVTGCLVDPFGGIAHLRTGVLETPDDPNVTLSEDPLRIIRAIRFAVRLNGRFTPRLEAAIRATRSRLSIVAAERRLGELMRIYEARQLNDALRLAAQLDVLDEWIPGYAPDAVDRLESAWCLEETLAGLLMTHAEAEHVLRAMKLPAVTIRETLTLIGFAVDLEQSEVSDSAARRIIRRTTQRQLTGAARVVHMRRGSQAAIEDHMWEIAKAGGPQLRFPLPLGGSDLKELGLRGSAIRDALLVLEETFCREGHLTRDEALALVGS